MAEYSTILEGKVWEDQVLSISKCTIVVRRLTMRAIKAGVSRICCHTSKSMNISMIPQDVHLKTIFPWKPPTYDPNFHGIDGPIHTSFSTWRVPQEREWIAASAKLGARIGSPKDGWSGDHIGFFHSLSSIDRSAGHADGTRSYAVTGYLLPNASRPNLHVLTDALVSKVVVDSESVTGLEFLHLGNLYSVKTKKEVVLSAGAFKTPQILELSGIGNPDVLAKAGIKCQVENRRVGENLQDHPTVGFTLELADGEESMDALKDPIVAQKCLEEYMAKKDRAILEWRLSNRLCLFRKSRHT
jgi:hypothetical protein